MNAMVTLGALGAITVCLMCVWKVCDWLQDRQVRIDYQQLANEREAEHRKRLAAIVRRVS